VYPFSFDDSFSISYLLKLTDGQFENAKIKLQNGKLSNPPAADSLFY